MIRTAIINTQTNLVENVVEYQTAVSGIPPGFGDNFLAVASDVAGPGWLWQNGVLSAPVSNTPVVPVVPSFIARELFALLTVADYNAIKTATASNDSLGLLWDSLKAQGDAPILITSARFQAGWSGLKVALGAARATAIAAALGFPG